ncbi:MAG: TonB-dependent receptor [candidate division KSB1 bacterium]|nr:TonB-dependent receptor [candidate division KSB1 bacterium]MDZ7365998.1 TonB-dependent receptor [candidate division KSB1 bacterium]MDZ7404115.1 TonB-dependent receptor [candidate division KSB1 bacterium]
MFESRRLWLKTAFVVCVLLGSNASLVWAQTATLRGRVTDAQSGEGLPQASVQVTAPGVQTGAASDVDGTYTVSNLAAGTYTVTVTYVGYERKILTVTLGAGENRTLNIGLSGTGVELNPVVVSASRRQEKILDAPASVTVLEATQIRGRAATTPTDYLRGLPAVDISTNGIAQSNVTVRGFNNIFSTVLLSLTDNRYANVPSLRLNAYNFIPLTAEDISRIEVVLGPGAALYGPNSANGVMHIITRSPFESPGTIVSVGGGGRDFVNFARTDPSGGRNIFMAGFRHASELSEKVGLKISGQYYQGQDWENFDPAEPATVTKFRPTASGPQFVGGPVSNARDFQVEKFAGELRLDFRLNSNTTLILNSGYNRADQIELTGIGAAQGIDWGYFYGQARFNHKNLFLQGFVNGNNAGDTYIRRTGQLIIDRSKLFVGQIQHSLELGQRQRFTYGFDGLFTRPNSDGTIYGNNEDKDNLNELGVYLQSETKLHPTKLDFVGALRADDNNHLEDPVFSPRAALIFKPNSNNTLRLTYNRAFNTQSPLDLFLDILQSTVANPLRAINPAFNQYLITGRGRGVPVETGFTFRRGADGRPQMRSQFDQNPDFADATVNNVWPTFRAIILGGITDPVQRAQLNALIPTQLSETINGILRSLATGGVLTADQIKDVDPVRPSITNTIEAGYKGVLGNKLLLSVDVYSSRIKDRVAGLQAVTPGVFLDAPNLLRVLGKDIAARLIANGVPPAQAQAQATAIVQQLTPTIAQFAALPVGVINPEQQANSPTKDTDVIATYRNFGEVSINGMDLSLFYNATANWAFGMNYSFVTKNGFNIFKRPNRVFFRNVDNTGNNISLNAPGNKIALSVQYRAPERGYEVELRGRYIDGFPHETGVFIGEVQTYSVFDLNFGYDLPFSKGTRWSINAINILDKKHREFIGAPILGRLILTRITQSL